MTVACKTHTHTRARARTDTHTEYTQVGDVKLDAKQWGCLISIIIIHSGTLNSYYEQDTSCTVQKKKSLLCEERKLKKTDILVPEWFLSDIYNCIFTVCITLELGVCQLWNGWENHSKLNQSQTKNFPLVLLAAGAKMRQGINGNKMSSVIFFFLLFFYSFILQSLNILWCFIRWKSAPSFNFPAFSYVRKKNRWNKSLIFSVIFCFLQSERSASQSKRERERNQDWLIWLLWQRAGICPRVLSTGCSSHSSCWRR